MTAKKASPRRKTAEEKRRAARRAELRLKKKRAEEALRRKRSRAAKKGWKTREAKKAPKKSAQKVATHRKKVTTERVKKTSKKKPSLPRKGTKKRKALEAFAAQLTKESILETANALREAFRDIPDEIGGPKTLHKSIAIARASKMTQKQRDKFMRDPSFENLQDMAGDDDNVEEIDDHDDNAFWYH